MSDQDVVSRLNAALQGRYRVERRIGEGGMATVYLADDLRHERQVALKVLKPELAAVVGAERFLAEIKTTAKLQHPHILPLHDSGSADGFLFYVMPYVEGESLRERLDREHQLPVDDAVRIATNVAEALDYAHSHGVIHRDIKPANILLLAGKPVISDFGIALAVSAGGGGRLTETGLSLGTPHYMSPEQATGDLSVGAASDIYALGCVLYEMLVGEPPYTGSTPQAILGKIIQAKPVSATEARATIPPHVDAAIRRALEKVPADRFAAANDLAAALATPSFRYGTTSAVPTASAGRWRAAALGASAVAVLLAAGLVASLSDRGAAPQTRRIRLEPFGSSGSEALGDVGSIEISGDGSRVVFGYGRNDERSQRGLWTQAWDDRDATPIPGTEGGRTPALSPDGRRLAFMVDDNLRVTNLDNGDAVTVLDSLGFTALSWGSDGFIYGTFNGTGNPVVYRLPEGGGLVEEMTSTPPEDRGTTHREPQALPDGRGLLFTVLPAMFDRSRDRVAVLDLVSGEQRELLAGHAARYSPTGHLLYISPSDQLMAVPFDLETLTTRGSPTIIQANVVALEFSQSGDLFVLEGTRGAQTPEVLWIDRQGNEEPIDWQFDTGGNTLTDPALSPDGTRLALAVPVDDSLRLFVKDLVGGTVTPLEGNGATPAWSRDGRDIGFQSTRVDGKPRLWRRRWDGSGLPAAISGPVGNDDDLEIGHWSLDGDILIGSDSALSRLGSGADSIGEPLITGAVYGNPTLSPDGRWVAFESGGADQRRLFVRPYPEVDERVVAISVGEGAEPRWSPDGRELFYSTPASEGGKYVMSARLRTDPEFQVVARDTVFHFQDGYTWYVDGWLWDLSPDASRFVVVRWRRTVGELSHFVLIQHFDEELKRLVPTR